MRNFPSDGVIHIIRRFSFIIVTLFIVFFSNTISTYAAAQNYDVLMPAAKKYIGVPYKYGGTTVSGFDCSGYVRTVLGQAGISLPRTTGEQYNSGVKVDKANLRIGDLVFFNTSGSGVSHSGIYIGDDQFIHSQNGKGVSISSLNDPYYWKARYLGARRYLSYDLQVASFHDIPTTYWAYNEIETLATDRLIIGYEDSYFYPETIITKADVAALLAVAKNLDMSNRTETFKDVSSDHWAVGAINALQEQGINGGEEGNFNPDKGLTRAQLATWFSTLFSLEEAKEPIEFTDVDASHWAYDAIQRLAASGITTGYEDQSFKPDAEINRSQFAAFLYRALY
ncbi:C40 family peptidase [Bacillus sp. SM2101]|uniref:C40 family peptidase n=1 Tax=Bacillus sp. SM2101 TaxID=2805366 RepID=UPI002032B26C|nr:C40 family peptidase [Bacillus sp. SM2101]